MKYLKLAECYDSLESTTLKIKKAEILSDLLESSNYDDLDILTLLSMGRVFPEWSNEELGVASQIIVKAISKAYGISSDLIVEDWKQLGDLGLVAEKLCSENKQKTLFGRISLSMDKVFSNFKNIPKFSGNRSQEKKILQISELLVSAKPIEARYIVRTVIGELRIGVAEGIMRDAIAKAFFSSVLWYALLQQNGGTEKRINTFLENTTGKHIVVDAKFQKILTEKYDKLFSIFEGSNTVYVLEKDKIESLSLWKKESGIDFVLVYNPLFGNDLKNNIISVIERAHSITNDFSKVCTVSAMEGLIGLKNLNIDPLRPIKVMLYTKAKGFDDAFNTVGKPAALEYKYDGFRMQLHCHDGVIKLFTRRLDDVTEQFPDVVEAIMSATSCKNYILDAEVIGFDPNTGKWLSFQNVSRRIRRKYDIVAMSKEIPVIVNIFDALKIGNVSLLDMPFMNRRKLIESIITEIPNKVLFATQMITSSVDETNKFYENALALGNEGIMMKNLEAPYKPGSRIGYGVKIKPIMETLDLVIISAEYGEGKRSAWFSSFELACHDVDTGEFLSIGKMGTGINEKLETDKTSFKELTELLTPLVLKEEGKKVTFKPSVVVEVAYEEVQKSTTYTSGFALRFPRLVVLRSDRSPEDISDINKVSSLFIEQRGNR
ncbi:MAG: ATP-dependent DNA ligase [DPANN group archaeon]|nr:ATP-dependent DNA ligase [DPANN group archaeon]